MGKGKTGEVGPFKFAVKFVTESSPGEWVCSAVAEPKPE